jgi:hypothetical protein
MMRICSLNISKNETWQVFDSARKAVSAWKTCQVLIGEMEIAKLQFVT